MFKKLFYTEAIGQKKWWFAFHVALGFASIVSNLFLIAWFYIVLTGGISVIVKENQNTSKLSKLFHFLVYLAPFEMLSRMVSCSPFIPFELGKYLTFFLLIWALVISNDSYKLGYWVILLCIPGIIIGWPLAPDYRYIVFNIMGLLNFGLAIAVFGRINVFILRIRLMNIVRLMIYPLLTALIFALLKTPDYDEMSFELGANFDASGGFGSNQVSTAFGLGMFLTFYLWYNNYTIFGFNRFLDLCISMLFLFQGLMTFSRGGIIGGILVILVLIFKGSDNLKRLKTKNHTIMRTVFLAAPVIILVLLFANNLTKGNLLLRYQGETQGTLLGVKEKTLNTITTGRFDIFLGDLRIFLDNPLFGVGVNASRYFRDYHNGVVAHVELSRLLAEHGILGVGLFGIVIFVLIKAYRNRGKSSLLFLFALIGVYTTFHAATRTFISPLFMGMAVLSGTNQKRSSQKVNRSLSTDLKAQF